MTRLLRCVVLTCASLSAATVQFDPVSPQTGPFPSDFLTVRDPAQKTGLRVNLPLADCGSAPSTCAEIGLINRLDGFSLNPRIRVRFSGPVDLNTLRNGVFLVWLDRLADDEGLVQPSRHVTPINQLQYDPATNTLFAKPDELLAQTRRYALVVTDAVKDTNGQPVRADAGFDACLAGTIGGRYCDQLGIAMSAAAAALAPARVVGGSVFTTLSATAFLDQIPDLLRDAPLGLTASTNVAVADLASLVLRMHVGTNPAKFQDVPVPLDALAGVGHIAFGSFLSPNFLTAAGRTIAPTPTADAVTLPAASVPLQFHVFLPQSPRPAGGYPVVLAGSGTVLGQRFALSSAVAATLAARGFAVAAINPVGHGFGPEGKIALTDRTGGVRELPFGGRGIDQNQDGAIGMLEGWFGASGFRDSLRQTAVDLMQFVHVIRTGVDLDGDGVPDLDGSQVYLLGQCLGADYGLLVQAADPGVRSAVLSSPYDSMWSAAGSIQSFARPWVLQALANRTPSLVNKPGPDFESLPAQRGAPVRLVDVPGALDIQEYFERMEWMEMPASAMAFARRLASKRIVFQMSKGDLIVPNCNTSTIIRAAGAREMTSVYRHDLALAAVPGLTLDPHLVLVPDVAGPPAGLAITLAAQQQIAAFFASDSLIVPDVNATVRPLFGKALFEIPEKLPDGLIW